MPLDRLGYLVLTIRNIHQFSIGELMSSESSSRCIFTLCRGKVIGLSVGLSVCLSVCTKMSALSEAG